MERVPTLPGSPPTELLPETSREHSRRVRTRLMEAGLHDGATWRISPTPFLLTSADLSAIQSLGPHLLRFTHALNRLYYESVRGAQPTWVADYLDQGKPPDLIAYARMNRFHTALPGVIRPDLILTEDGFMISELDSVPGGIGLTGCMGQAYADLGWPIIGERDGMVAGFAQMIRSLPHDQPNKPLQLAIVVSEEAKDYRPEMLWLAARLREAGLPAQTVSPEDVIFTEEGLFLAGSTPLTVLYRFFELAWGSRGVSVGHDLPQTEWAAALEAALASFHRVPRILQEFRKGRRVAVSYHDHVKDEIVPMPGRVRLSPYYFIAGDHVELAGILATVCPLDKKLIHGMPEAVMAPCALAAPAPAS